MVERKGIIMPLEPSEETVKKFINYCQLGLVKGLGKPVPGEMCVEAAIALAHDFPHQDQNPSCVPEEAAECKIALNDCDAWEGNKSRAKGMVKIGIAQLGSNKLKDGEFKNRMKLNSMRMILPYLIQKQYNTLVSKDEQLLAYKTKFELLEKVDNKLLYKFYHYYKNNYYSNIYNSQLSLGS